MSHPKTVFLLEDDKILLRELEKAFSEDGFAVSVFTNQIDFQEALEGPVRPSVMILDIMVPEARLTKESYEALVKATALNEKQIEPAISAGIRIARDIKQSNKYAFVRGVPIVMYTVVDKPEFRKDAMDLNVKYFVKGSEGSQDLRDFVANITADK